MLPINWIRLSIAAAVTTVCGIGAYFVMKIEEEEQWVMNIHKLCERIYNKNNNILLNKIARRDIESLYRTYNVTDFINEMYKLFYENMAKNKSFPKQANKDNDDFMKYLYAVRNVMVHSENSSYEYVKQNYSLLCKQLQIQLCEYKVLSEDDRLKVKNYFMEELDKYLKRVILELGKIKE